MSTTFPFNVVLFDHERIPPASAEKAIEMIGRWRGIKLDVNTYLVVADFTTLVLHLLALPGCQDGGIKLYCLSAFDGELDKDGIHTTIRKQARSHLRHELGKLKLDLPDKLRD
jgi:hypothetical protein